MARLRLHSSSANRRCSTTAGIEPLFLWLGAPSSSGNASVSIQSAWAACPLLLPTGLIPSTNRFGALIESTEQVLERVATHYASSENFVGGMGESDPGVWFAAASGTALGDALESAELIQQSVELVKEERHGVPFGIYTTGLVTSTVPLTDLDVDCIQVSLFAATPKEYELATGLSKNDASKAFGTVCGFLVDAVEQGISVEVGVKQEFATTARDLALSLGARYVHVYP